ncbi:hypothetical protein P8452_16778 [Trifolium repens]|jgi:hypothetical protein|nr:hypothetical protein P8452_16778 [Trifolium repens]
MMTTNAITILVMMLMTVTSQLPTPSVSLNVSEMMMSRAAVEDSLSIAAGIISAVKIDIDLTSQSSITRVTMFIPVGAAFKQLHVSASPTLRSLTVDYKYILMKAHIVRGYYPPTVLRSINKL